MSLQLDTIDRQEFLTQRWHYRAGDHVTIVGPSGWGKTYLAYQLLALTATPKLPACVLVIKPRDKTVREFSKAQGYRIVKTWPPVRVPFTAPRPGYTLWPVQKPHRDAAVEDFIIAQQCSIALQTLYLHGDGIVFCDETAGLSEFGLDPDLRRLWQRGRSMGAGLWASTQRPVKVPLDAYSNAAHLFFGRDLDKRSRDRYSEISGINPRELSESVLALSRYQWLYIQVNGPTGRPRMCVVDA